MKFKFKELRKNLWHFLQSSNSIADTRIAGGFGTKIDSQIRSIVDETGIHGSVINVHNMIELVQKYEASVCTHADLRKIFTVDRQIITNDFVF